MAHADVVKATLQQQQRERDQADATLAAQKARLDLGVLLFADPRTPFTLADDTATPPAPPLRAEVDAAAAKNNPELRSALAAVHAADEDVTLSRAGYLPSLALNYTYGIDAPQFATNGSEGIRNLGYSASATLDIPIWDWLATHDRVKQSELRRTGCKDCVELCAAPTAGATRRTLRRDAHSKRRSHITARKCGHRARKPSPYEAPL